MNLKIISSIIFVLAYYSAFACTCANGLDSVRVNMNSSDVAFKGTLIARVVIEDPADTTYTYDEKGKLKTIHYTYDEDAYMLYRLKVERVYKGKLNSDTVQVRGPVRSSCMANIDFGKPFLIFAYEKKKVFKKRYFRTHYCAGNKEFEQSDEVILTKKTKYNK